ncbi:MAG: hypothetical protein AVDCRST_MAG67-669 [uncultured Solirubrobacteraceae bacterium]|uniref:Uncharacterized protein n=1 Tax=uncultured Solirubrobacteraceae bacterium TaxID=1162706 RepID=A0A6J4RP32_9ACTN|nr:MAG: hypothetical protein AVDCRST_MAG67-669 [uncultured Solirubrobacteraceae bacterium]
MRRRGAGAAVRAARGARARGCALRQRVEADGFCDDGAAILQASITSSQ